MSNALYGWDLLYASVEKDIKNNQDVLVCFVHLVLVSNGFKCIGLGDSKNVDGTETKTESLPNGWNENYTIRYLYQGRLYNLRATSMDDAVMINLIRVDERTVSTVQLNTRSVAQRNGSLDEMLPENSALIDTIKKQLIDKVIASSKTKESSSQTVPEAPRSIHSADEPPQPPSRRPYFDPLARPDPFGIGGGGVGGVGSRDLDPFAGVNPLRPFAGIPPGGGGMLFEPPRGPRFEPGPAGLGIPPGSLPPGARFDPIRPPAGERFPRRPNNPDSDEMPPPGFEDMYM